MGWVASGTRRCPDGRARNYRTTTVSLHGARMDKLIDAGLKRIGVDLSTVTVA
jgi:hypothetical protein